MLERERHHLILKLIEDRSVVSVSDLVELLSASEATIRRDINAMADRGEVRRVRGGAEALRPRHQTHLGATHFSAEESIAVSQKYAIAKAAAALLEDGDSIVINGGTTTYQLADFLRHKKLDILTNSFPLATELARYPALRVNIPGGRVYPQQNIILSPFEQNTSQHFWGRILFAGCYGLNAFGVMETDPLIARSVLSMLSCAEKLVILADSRKLRQRSSLIVAPLSRVSMVITDEGADEADQDMLRSAGIEVVIVKSNADEQLDTKLQNAS